LSKLINLDISIINQNLIPALESRKVIAGAYLYGSVLDSCRPDSDIDLGILLEPDISQKEAEKILEELYLELPTVKNHPYDIIILNNCSAIFAYRVITQGRLIYAGNGEAITDFMEKISRQRAENYPRFRRALELIVKG
jgi:predicted nucleotidyltransferase